MKYLIPFVAVVALVACTPADEDTAGADEAAATEETAADAAVMAADGQAPEGNYRIKLAAGTVLMEELKPDGTYVQTTEEGELAETGTWVQKSPEQFCYTADAEYVDEDTPAEEQCNSETVGEDGVWTSTNPEGETVTVERVAA